MVKGIISELNLKAKILQLVILMNWHASMMKDLN
jgi:hypothetical protein